MSKVRSKIKTGTKLDEEERSKRAAGEFEDRLEAIGQESEEKAAKWVIEENDEVEVKREREYNDALSFFSKKNKRFTTYYNAIARQIQFLLDNYVDWGSYGFSYKATVNEARGVGVMIRNPIGEYYARGFKPCGEPKYDIHAIKVLILQTENIVEEYAKKQEEAHRSNSTESKNN